MGASDAWSVTWETHPWLATDPTRPLTRSQRALLRRTYDAAIPPAISGLEVTIDAVTLAAADDARAEVSRFDAELSAVLPGTEIAPLSAVLLRTESASSSQIENITAGGKALAMAEIGAARHGSNAALVAANVDAMKRAVDLAEDLTPSALLAIHEELMRGQTHADPGRLRSGQVWIGGSAASPHGAVFVPPTAARVPAAIDDLCAFTARTDVPLLVQAAIAHAQFETIHPFNDGNGRTGRALVHAMLQRGGATTRATVPVSAGLLADTDAYFEALMAYRRGDLDPIVSAFAEATLAAIGNGRRLAQELTAIHERWTATVTARSNATVWKVLSSLLNQPATTSAAVQSATGLSQPAADQVIRTLRDAGVLTRAAGVQRYVVWVATDVTSALDRFAVRARRR